jgi:hypothetical protein
VAKKRTASRKPARARSASKKRPAPKRAKASADSSRLDTAPLQAHIEKRIKELEDKSAARSAVAGDDDTLQRLRVALETLRDICEPTMTVPI